MEESHLGTLEVEGIPSKVQRLDREVVGCKPKALEMENYLIGR